jgi:hypothetical protein
MADLVLDLGAAAITGSSSPTDVRPRPLRASAGQLSDLGRHGERASSPTSAAAASAGMVLDLGPRAYITGASSPTSGAAVITGASGPA